jgi:hypothetical protein
MANQLTEEQLADRRKKNKKTFKIFGIVLLVILLIKFLPNEKEKSVNDNSASSAQSKEEELKQKLTPEQYRVLRENGIELAFSGKLISPDTDGFYKCAVCGNPLFKSDAKFDSGWVLTGETLTLWEHAENPPKPLTKPDEAAPTAS